LPWWTYAVFAGLAGLLMFTFAAVVGVPSALVIFVVLLVVGWVFIWRRATLIVVDDEFLTVGSQRLPLQEVGHATALDAGSLQMVAGQDADPRAHLVLRNLSSKTGVKIELTTGPTPYWLVSSNRPDVLADVLTGP
jgi:hypothetical protein